MTPKDLFEILVREHADLLMVYLRTAVRDRGVADDIFQETLLTAWKNLHRFDKSRPFGPWLRGIAAKLVLAERRKAARRSVLIDAHFLENLSARCEDVRRQSGDTLEEKLEGLRECMQSLAEPYRETIRLRYAENVMGQSLADRLGISVENLKKRLQRGREKLLECLSGKLANGAIQP